MVSGLVPDEIGVGSHERVLVGTGDRIEESGLVEFRLLYEGELLNCTNTKRRADEKHEIRRYLHSQLRRLWQVNRNLAALAKDSRPQSITKRYVEEHGSFTEEEAVRVGIECIADNWTRNGFRFVPLITERHCLQCSIDVLLLRPQEKRFVFEQGDIDGQLKTLFDALRIPASKAECGGMEPQEGENPMFCLLEDDRLISQMKVTTDQLLLLPRAKELKANDCFATIHVKLNYRDGRVSGGNYFG